MWGGTADLVNVEYHRDLKEVQSDPQLADMLGAANANAPFDRLAWWQGLADHCGLLPQLVAAREGSDCAVLPLAGSGPRLAGLANWYTFRLRPVLSGENSARLLVPIARDLARRARRITLTGLPDEEGSATLLETAFRKAGWLVLRRPCDTNHVLSLSGRSFDEYLSARPGKLRTTLKRKSGKVQTRILDHFDADVWRQYEDIYAESWKPEEGSPAFLRSFAEAEGAAGRLRLAIAYPAAKETCAAQPTTEAIAAQMWTVEGTTAFIHKLAHRESAKPLSPGSVLSAALFRHVIDVDRVAMVDFGTGNDGYKRDWMEDVRPRYQLDMFRPANPANWPTLLRMGLSRLAAAAKRG